ncbi:MAG: hypothetical protein WCV82_03800 [Candidatus Paceibacterota bacterium]|jgi:hypothetical protein
MSYKIPETGDRYHFIKNGSVSEGVRCVPVSDAEIQVAGVNCSGYAPSGVATPGWAARESEMIWPIDHELSDYAEQQWHLAHPCVQKSVSFDVHVHDDLKIGTNIKIGSLMSVIAGEKFADRRGFTIPFVDRPKARNKIWQWVRSV